MVSSIAKLSVASLFTGDATLFFAKAPILLFYIRVFRIKRWLRVTCYIVLATTAVVYAACAIYSGVNCIPGNNIYSLSFLSRCLERNFIPVLVRCFTSITSDAVAISLPLAVVTKLKLPVPKKMALALVFMMGIL
ncbi:hypothetical protein F4774DRAFT_193048 [Daldinia eschscholtzii]|nr:hypothetical protein F4774DRAFT_193048 [Daldinia eschscholtzii]